MKRFYGQSKPQNDVDPFSNPYNQYEQVNKRQKIEKHGIQEMSFADSVSEY